MPTNKYKTDNKQSQKERKVYRPEKCGYKTLFCLYQNFILFKGQKGKFPTIIIHNVITQLQTLIYTYEIHTDMYRDTWGRYKQK